MRKDGTLKYLRPDGKVQVTVEYDENDKPIRIDTIVISTQHAEEITLDQIKRISANMLSTRLYLHHY